MEVGTKWEQYWKLEVGVLLEVGTKLDVWSWKLERVGHWNKIGRCNWLEVGTQLEVGKKL